MRWHLRGGPVLVLLIYTVCIQGQAQNRAPVWYEDLKSVLVTQGIRENARVGDFMGILKATDPDEDQVYYSIESDFFEVNRDTGVVKLKRTLDREAASEIRVTFYATDTKGNRTPVSYLITILDVNDNNPRFVNVPYSTSIQEGAATGTVVFTGISVTDQDRGSNAAIRLSCYARNGDTEALAACSMFKVQERQVSVGNYKGTVTLSGRLDYESRRKYIMTLEAKDGGEPYQRSLVNLVIQVIDIQDMDPRFLNTPLSIAVYENLPAGRRVGVLRAQDQDVGAPNPLKITILQDPRGFFTLDDATKDNNGVWEAIIRTAGRIDREAISGSYSFQAKAVEIVDGKMTESSAVTTVTVTLRDVNDNKPKFNHASLEITVPEALAMNTQLPGLNLLVSDADLGDGRKFRLSLRYRTYDTFAVSPITGSGSAAVSLIVKKPQYMDYEQAQYRRQIVEIVAAETATAEQFSSTTTLTVNLRDVNDNAPMFRQSEYRTAVREDRSVGSKIMTITATDADSGSYGVITYSLSGANYQKLRVNSQTGEIFIAQKLDYETTKRLSLMFTATDGGGRRTSVNLYVDVTDYNDQGPRFQSDSYRTIVWENSTQLYGPVTVKATDSDASAYVTYKIVRGNTADFAFHVGGRSGELYLRRRVGYQETPGRRGYFELIVEASDNGIPPQTSKVPVIVTVKDVNDKTPQFRKSYYFKEISELAPPGTSVLILNATDEDYGPNAQIGYNIDRGARGHFVINYFTGLIQVERGAKLDRDRIPLYNLIVHAVDKGSLPKTGVTRVAIRIKDANNKPPVFSQTIYIASVNETAGIGSPVVRVQARDPDDGAVIEYSIQSSSIVAKDKNGGIVTSIFPFNYRMAFVINSRTGEITVNKLLLRQSVAEISFTVQAKDTKAERPQPQIGTANVVITIRTSQDSGLVFDLPWTRENPVIYVKMREEREVGSVVYGVAARDPITKKPVRDYRKVEGSDPNNYFRVSRGDGQVFLNRRLDYETLAFKEISFQIRAYSPGPIVRTAVATIRVQVEDFNDHNPQFEQAAYSFQVSEKSIFPTRFGTVVAKDKDSGVNAQIKYSLTGDGHENFGIEPTTGQLYVAQNAKLDREERSSYYLLVAATDQNGKGRATQVSVYIKITDENDHAPKFTHSEYKITVSSSVSIDTLLGRVHATDQDQGQNGQIVYSIRSGNERGLFVIDGSTGVLRTSVRLTGHSSSTPYHLVVQAQDRGTPPKSSMVSVFITITAEQTEGGAPQFIFPEKDGLMVYVVENAKPGTVVTTIIARAGDGTQPGQVTYGFLTNKQLMRDHKYFRIDPNTGVITTNANATLDRESKEYYQLVLLVRDKSKPPKETTRNLIVAVRDVEDNDPTFLNCPFMVIEIPQIRFVKEEQLPGQHITEVKGCDRDAPPNNNLFYFIISGNNDTGSGKPFYLNMTTGVMTSRIKLDREKVDRYEICIKVSNDPNYVVPKNVECKFDGTIVNQDPTIQKLVVFVEDINDHGPIFPGGDGVSVKASLLTSTRYGSQVVKLVAIDRDSQKNAVVMYSIQSSTFVNRDGKQTPAPGAFTISATGTIHTNLVNYIDYIDGHFLLKVMATDHVKRATTANVYIYIVRESQRMSFMIKGSPEYVSSIQAAFIKELEAVLKGTTINVDRMQYHVTEGGFVNLQWTDLCFHLVENNRVVDPKVGQEKLSKTNEAIRTIYEKYKVESVGSCKGSSAPPVGAVTSVQLLWFEWCWWVLLIAAIIIFLVCLFLIIFICCWWKRYKRQISRSKPYIILEPVSAIPRGPGYEWQETSVKMN